jgi:hypothetical protein
VKFTTNEAPETTIKTAKCWNGEMALDGDAANCPPRPSPVPEPTPPESVSSFLAGTRISTSNGEVSIESLSVGDKVLSFDPNSLKTSEDRVEKIYTKIADEYYFLKFDNGSELKVTAHHPIFINNKIFVEVRDLKVNDQVWTTTIPTKIISIQKVNSENKVYNLKISNNKTYFANGIGVHNKSNNSTNNDSSSCYSGGGCWVGQSDQQGTCIGNGTENGGYCCKNGAFKEGKCEVKSPLPQPTLTANLVRITYYRFNGSNVSCDATNQTVFSTQNIPEGSYESETDCFRAHQEDFKKASSKGGVFYKNNGDECVRDNQCPKGSYCAKSGFSEGQYTKSACTPEANKNIISLTKQCLQSGSKYVLADVYKESGGERIVFSGQGCTPPAEDLAYNTFVKDHKDIGSQLKADLDFILGYQGMTSNDILARGLAAADLLTFGSVVNLGKVNAKQNQLVGDQVNFDRVEAAARVGITVAGELLVGAPALAMATGGTFALSGATYIGGVSVLPAATGALALVEKIAENPNVKIATDLVTIGGFVQQGIACNNGDQDACANMFACSQIVGCLEAISKAGINLVEKPIESFVGNSIMRSLKNNPIYLEEETKLVEEIIKPVDKYIDQIPLPGPGPRCAGSRGGWCGFSSFLTETVSNEKGFNATSYQLADVAQTGKLPRLTRHAFSVVEGKGTSYLVDQTVGQFVNPVTGEIGGQFGGYGLLKNNKVTGQVSNTVIEKLINNGYVELTEKNMTEYLKLLTGNTPDSALSILQTSKVLPIDDVTITPRLMKNFYNVVNK